MNVLEKLREKYRKLPLEEKKWIGEALLKVNLGVATPADSRFVAGFLRGSGLVANKGKLDDLLALLNEGEKTEKVVLQKEKTLTVSEKILESDSLSRRVAHFEQDSEITEKTKKIEK